MTVQIHDKAFVPFISKQKIQERIAELGAQISADYEGQNPLLIGILNGSFMFAADLMRTLTISAEISFIKLASYKGTTSTGNVVTAIGMEENLQGRHIILVEDIIDTGRTLASFMPDLLQRNPASVRIATFLTKPEALKFDVQAHYSAFDIPNAFVVGYGLDYDGLGRNLDELYILNEV
jgi:hypoxanthine phosphoribosyltransferase